MRCLLLLTLVCSLVFGAAPLASSAQKKGVGQACVGCQGVAGPADSASGPDGVIWISVDIVSGLCIRSGPMCEKSPCEVEFTLTWFLNDPPPEGTVCYISEDGSFLCESVDTSGGAGAPVI